jgi:hypothetical protein
MKIIRDVEGSAHSSNVTSLHHDEMMHARIEPLRVLAARPHGVAAAGPRLAVNFTLIDGSDPQVPAT